MWNVSWNNRFLNQYFIDYSFISFAEWDPKQKRMVVNLPNGSTRTLGIEQEAHKRYFFGVCPVTSKIGNLKTCAGCKVVGYIGKEEQKEETALWEAPLVSSWASLFSAS